MIFDFDKFYSGLVERGDDFNPFDNYWSAFPQGMKHLFKSQTLALLNENTIHKDSTGLACTLAVILNDGADRDYTDILLFLLDEDWHTLEEDIISALELTKDPKSIDKLYEAAVNVPDYDEMRALAKKCIYALSAIRTQEAIDKLKLLRASDDPIISENAAFELDNVIYKK